MSLSVQSVGSAGSSGSNCARLHHLGSIHIPAATANSHFDASQHLSDLARYLDPRSNPKSFAVRPVGLHRGVWIVSCKGRPLGWLVKQVAAHRKFSGLPTEVEACDLLLGRFPGLLSDSRLAFPHSVISLQGRNGDKVADLLISSEVPGVQLGSYLAELNLQHTTDQQQLERVCSSVGELLADFHTRYADPITGEATRHSDFHPSNVLYDRRTDTLSIVDLTGMGSAGINDDVEKFERLMGHLAGERYAAVFRLRYIAVAKMNPSLAMSGRSSTRSTAASSTDSAPLYSSVSKKSPSSSQLAPVFKVLSSLLVPPSGFDPSRSITSLAWLIFPERRINQPKVIPLKHLADAWLITEENRFDCWLLQKVSARKDKSSYSIAQRCERLAKRFPELLVDDLIAYPSRVIPLQDRLKHNDDVLVTDVPFSGVELETYIQSLNPNVGIEQEKAEKVLRKVGQTLATFHCKYQDEQSRKALQHGHFTVRNVLYDEKSSNVCLIGFSDVGFSDGDDVQSFIQSIKDLCWRLDVSRLIRAFQKGYSRSGPRQAPQASGGLLGSWSCLTEIHNDSDIEAGESDESYEADHRRGAAQGCSIDDQDDGGMCRLM